MGVRADGSGRITDFERAHLQLSFQRSIVALLVGLPVAALFPWPVWLAVVYGLAFCFGRRAGFRMNGGKGDAAERFLARFVAWEDSRPGLVVMVAILVPFVVLAMVAKLFGAWLEEFREVPLIADDALRLLGEAFAVATVWNQPPFAVCVLLVGSLGAVSGLNDGFWVGSVQSRTGARFRETIPFGGVWTDWRNERQERRKVYLRGGG